MILYPLLVSPKYDDSNFESADKFSLAVFGGDVPQGQRG
jgi:hypothetical protein